MNHAASVATRKSTTSHGWAGTPTSGPRAKTNHSTGSRLPPSGDRATATPSRKGTAAQVRLRAPATIVQPQGGTPNSASAANPCAESLGQTQFGTEQAVASPGSWIAQSTTASPATSDPLTHARVCALCPRPAVMARA